MKRLFTFAAVALMATMAFAQSQQAQRRVPYTTVQHAIQLGQVGPQARLDALAKAESANEVGHSRLVRAGHTARVAADQQLTLNETVLANAKPGRTVSTTPYKAPAKVTETDGNLTITKDANGIITNVTGAEVQVYQRDGSGQAFYRNSSNQLVYSAQSGTANIIIDGNSVYMQDVVSKFNTGAWVKGTKDGNTITVAAHQPVLYSSDYATTLSVRWGKLTSAGKFSNDDAHAEAFTFTIDGDNIILEGCTPWDGSADTYYMGIFWDDDNSFQGYADLGTKLLGNYTPPSTELVTLPAGVTAEAWYLNAVEIGYDSTNEVTTETPVTNQNVKVAFTGNDVYVQGVFADFPDAWIKGTKNGDKYEFDNLQYIGDYASYNIWCLGVSSTTGDFVAPNATYDAAAKTITFDCDLLANADATKIYYLTWLAEVVLSGEQGTAPEEPVLNEQTATLPYLNTFDTEAEQAQVAIYDANADGKTFSFQKDGKNADDTDNYAARYTYNGSKSGDDYLVFPAVQLEAGKVYNVSLSTRAQSTSYVEKVAVYCGKESKVSAFTTEVIAPTDVTEKEYFTLSNGAFTVSETGMYTFAVKACSDADKYYLWVDNFSVVETNPLIPATTDDLAVAADAAGAKKATITLTAPSKTVGGTALSGNLNMVIAVDGVDVVTKSVAPGAAVSEEITVETPGTYTVTATFSNADGVSETASYSAYIGVDKPGAVTGLTLADKSTTVPMSWTAPAAGANGGVFYVDDVTYNIYPVELVEFFGMIFPSLDTDNPLALGVTGTSAAPAFNTNEGEMGFTYLAVQPENEAGAGDYDLAAIVTGAPYALPVKESCAEGQLHYWFGTSCDDVNYDAEGGLYFAENASDGDGYNFEFVSMSATGFATLETGKINLGGASNPVVKFDAVNTLGTSKLEVYVITTEGTTLLKTIDLTAEYANYVVSLVDYKDADWVRVVFKGVFQGSAANVDENGCYALIDVDDLQIINYLDHNLAALSLTAPAKVEAGKDVTATLTVQNQGKLAVAAEDYTVKFTVNGVEHTVEGVALEADATAQVAYTFATSVTSPEEFVIAAEVVYAADEDQANNAAADVTVKVAMPKYPTAANVTATVEGTTVALSWEEPNLEAGVPVEVTEDFESYEPFQFGNAIGDWTLVDGDGYAMGGMQNTDVPNLVVGTTTGSFFLIDRDVVSEHSSFDPNNGGHQYLATMFAYDANLGSVLDDWLISPVLCGDAQTISFFAKSYSEDYPDWFQVLYSTTDMATESFVKVSEGEHVQAPMAWTEYSYDLPAGAKYFAIRCVSDDAFMLFVDDITYTPAADGNADLEIVGYNVYRDGAKVNDAPVAETSYVDAGLADATTYSYAVSVVYTQGESKTVAADAVTGIGSVNVEAGEAIYYNMQGVRVAKPAAGTTCIRVINGQAVKTVIR